MTTLSIINILNKLNKNSNRKDVIRHSISPNVEFAHIWTKENYNSNIPYTFFLIKKDIDYVGAVLDMASDLHWVILPEYRKKGYLTNALRASILPYIFKHLNRDEQKISINIKAIGLKNYNSSLNSALKVGFVKIDDCNLIITSDNLNDSFFNLNLIYNGLDDAEILNQLTELERAAKTIFQINSKIEMSFGRKTETYLEPSLAEISRKISYFKMVIDDIKHDYLIDK